MTREIIIPTVARLGDCRREIERAIQQCTAEHGGRLIGDPTVEVLQSTCNDGTQAILTIVYLEDGDPTGWWREWLTVHGWLKPKKA